MAGLLPTVTAALQEAFDDLEPGADPVVRPSEHADLQANGALGLAKRLGRPPREVAEAIVARADLGDICSTVEVAGPGFVNLRLSDAFLGRLVREMSDDPAIGVAPASAPRTVVVDYGGPNVAKQMHVGHLRSTIIGDALVRMLARFGHRVIRENHVGDWGTPFGMLIEHLVDIGVDQGAAELALGDLDTFYRQARQAFDSDPAFAVRSRERVVALQSGEPETLRLWKVLVSQSIQYFSAVFGSLGVLLGPEDVVGESFYNPLLSEIVSELDAKGLLVESEGARCVFPPGFVNREGEPLPLIVQKSDGGYNYAATDLAALRDRVLRLHAELILYIVGFPQTQHLEMVFATAALAGWLPEGTEAVHVAFGNVLGADGRMFKTRAGDTIKLSDLLEEAVQRAAAAVAEHNPSLAAAHRAEVARMVGIGAVKYADLSTDRVRDYRFDWDRMLAFEGNTGPYLQYAHARTRSILRRAEQELGPLSWSWPEDFGPPLESDERLLAKCLLRYESALHGALEAWSPHKLCGYLYDLAGVFTGFYERCPVLRSAEGGVRQRRLAMCALTSRVMSDGLGLLGIAAPEQM